jgi:radical SAM protein with 4Fe4S-binding SPASM domain
LPLSIDVNPRNIHHIDFQDSFIDGFIALAQIFVTNSGGILRYYSRRADVPECVWDTLNARANRRIYLLGQSMGGALAGNRDTELVLPALKDRGVEVKVLLLTPNKPKLQQFREVQMGLNRNVALRDKIEETIDKIQRLKHLLYSAGVKIKLDVRIIDRIIYSSISMFDSLALVTNYSSREEIGINSPTFLVCKTNKQDGGLFTFYEKELERYWRCGSHPEEERRKAEFDAATRILNHRPQVSKIERWFSGRVKHLPPPSMVVIYPTYKCSWSDQRGNEIALCENCIYHDMRGEKHLKWEVLSCLLEQAVLELGVERIEFSGGGEPLQYQQREALLSHLEGIRNRNKNVRFGLLTNGLYLDDAIVSSIAGLFSYVRFNYAEGIQGRADIETDFIRKLQGFLSRVKSTFGGLRVGLKVLLTRQNAKTLVEKLLGLEAKLGRDFQRIDHIRIKAMRSVWGDKFEPTEDDCRVFRNNFYDCLFTRGNWPDDVQVDLDLAYVDPRRFRCRLSPLIGVVDPDGSLVSCWNYARDYKRLKIGNLDPPVKLKDLWGSQRHREIVRTIDPGTVCNAPNGCPCRFVAYQRVLEQSDSDRSLYLPSATLTGFL